MTLHSEIQDGRSAFRSALHKIRELVDAGQFEQATGEAERAASNLWLNGVGIYHSCELEALLVRIGARLELPATSAEAGTAGQVTIATTLYATGGHSRICWRMMRIRSHERHTLVLTRQGDVPVPEQILDLEREGAIRIVRADAGSLAERARKLTDTLAMTKQVVLLTHPDDALPTIVLGSAYNTPPVMMIDHATHTFWLGATVINALLSVAPGPLHRRGFPKEQIVQAPLPLDLERLPGSGKSWIRQYLNIPADAPLLFTCASDYKYYSIDGRQLPDLLAPTMEHHLDTHLLVVGVTATPMWKDLTERFAGRIHILGHLSEAQTGDCYREADIYLDSFPVPSFTAMLEAAALGKPVVRYAPKDWRACGFSFDYEGLVDDTYIWTTPDEYRDDLNRLIAEPSYRIARGARNCAQVTEHHSTQAFSHAFEHGLHIAAVSPLIRPATSDGGTIEELDELLYKLAYNNAIQAGRRPAISPNQQIHNWLAARHPNSLQKRLIRTQLDAFPQRPGIGIVIRCKDSDIGIGESLKLTLHSIDALDPILPPQSVMVLSKAAALTTTTDFLRPNVQLHHASTADGNAAINHLAAESGCDWLLVVDAGDEFTPSGLLITALELLNAPDMRAICADEMIRTGDGNLSALCRPDFNLDLLLSMPSGMARHWLFRREAFLEVGGFDPEFADAVEFDLLLRLIDAGGIGGLGHVHEPLLVTPPQPITSKPSEQAAILRHLRHRGYEQARIEPTLPGCYRIHYGHRATPGVSIIIPTKNQFRLLLRCIDTLIEKTAYKNYEVLIVDNGSTEEDACTWLDGLEAMGNPQLRVIRYPQPFNYSAMNNLAAQHARGEYLVLLNNDTAILREDWLDAMLNHAQRPEVGAVGAKLLYPDGKIQHAGVVLGLRGPAEHPFIGESPDAPGYMYRLQVDQDYSAVTGACLMVRKSLYEEVGGLDEEVFKVSYNDVDLCLKIRTAGYLVVWTPHAVLLHEGSVSQAREDKAVMEKKALRFLGEQDAFYDKWLPVAAHDPAYNDNLTLSGPAFQVETNPPVAWNPLTWRPLPVAVAFAADQAGCGHYRIIQPAAAMRDFGLATADVCHRYLSPVEMERASPDTLVLQRQMTEDQIKLQKRVARFNKCFKVAELDDYLPQVPRKSAHHGTLPKDILKTMRKSLTLVDRFVVSTQGLAEMMQGMHPDIRVVENHLPLHWWADVKGERRTGRKPRVGWGGAAGHRGDLELIADVVEALSDEVEWVFFGMCPDKLKPFVHEIVQPVAIGDYPGRLASLNLDLAIAPLEDNTFNQCKSNLRLLEYGACGFPVVCSDVRPYQGDLPVTRVKPRFKEWTEAIRMHVNDLDAAAKAGDALREAIHRDWMLDEQYARFWLSQWMPD